jgi:beta-lactamase class A
MRRALRIGILVASVSLVAGVTPGTAAPRPWHPDMAAARRYAHHREGDVAFALIDQRGRYYGYRAATTAPAASVFKVMLLASFLRMRDGRGLSARDRALLGR